jgi:hypothetical protein
MWRSLLSYLVAVAANAGMLACSSMLPAVAERAAAPAVSRSQAPSGAGATGQLADLIKDWQSQKTMLVQLAEAMPADKFGYKPTAPQRNYGEQIMHIAIGNVEMMKLLGGAATPPFTMASAASVDTKEEIVKALSDAYDFGTAVLNAQTPESINLLLNKDIFFFGGSTRGRVVWTLLSHAMDIYGQMVVYVRLNGIVPPASRGI